MPTKRLLGRSCCCIYCQSISAALSSRGCPPLPPRGPRKLFCLHVPTLCVAFLPQFPWANLLGCCPGVRWGGRSTPLPRSTLWFWLQTKPTQPQGWFAGSLPHSPGSPCPHLTAPQPGCVWGDQGGHSSPRQLGQGLIRAPWGAPGCHPVSLSLSKAQP